MASTDAMPFPKKNVAFRVIFPIYDADGDLVTGATGLDSEVSKDQGTFTDCTNEATEIATASGIYYLDLSSTEMNADHVGVIVKTTSSGAKTTFLSMYPIENGDLPVNVTQIGGSAPNALISGRIDANVGAYQSGQAPLQPTTAGRTLDVTTTGEAGIDWANIGAPTTTQGLSGTTVKTATDVETDTADIQSRLPSALVSGRMDSSVGSYQSGNAPLQPTTAGRTLDVTVGGAAGIDWANVEGQTSGVNLISTIIQQSQFIGTDGITNSSLAASAITEIQAGLATTSNLNTSMANLLNYLLPLTLNTGTIGVTGNDATHIHLPALEHADDELIGYMLVIMDDDDTMMYVRFITDWVQSTALATLDTALPITPAGGTDVYWLLSEQAAAGGSAPTAAQVADAVWDEATTGHVTAGTFGEQAKTDIDSVLAQIGTAGAGLTNLPWNSAFATGLENGLIAMNLDKLVPVYSTADSGSTTTLVDAFLTQSGADHWKGNMLMFVTGPNFGVARMIEDFNPSTDTLTFTPPVNNAVSNGDQFVIFPQISQWDGKRADHTVAGTYGLDIALAGGVSNAYGLLAGTLKGLVLAEGQVGNSGNTTTTIHLPLLTDYATGDLNGYQLVIEDVSAGERYGRAINSWETSTNLATVDTLPFTPQDDTDNFWLIPPHHVNIDRINKIKMQGAGVLGNEFRPV